MSVKKRTKYSTYTGYQRVSLLNGNIPGRMAKPYHVSYYEFSETPGKLMYASRHDDWVPHLYDRSMTGVDVSRFPESADFLFDPLGLPNADSVADAATSKLIARVQEARDSGFNMAVFLAELNSTAGMVLATAKRIDRFQRELRRGNFKAAWRGLGVDHKGRTPKSDDVSMRAANYWLEGKYGWLPLLSDIFAAAHKLATTVAGIPRQSIKASAAQVLTQTSSTPSGAKHVRVTELGYRYTLTYRVSDPMVAYAASLGFTNPMLLVWEKLPMSFVFDWIYSVGNWLQGFSAFDGLALVDGCTTRKGRQTDTYTYPPGSSSGAYPFSYYDENGILQVALKPDWREEYTGSTIVVHQSGFHRSPMTSFPSVPAPRLRMPDTLGQLVTFLSLIRQRR